jgi:cytochrome c-type protein NapC
MFGTVITKIGGLRHVWYYYTEYQYYTVEEARPKIHIIAPFPNASCMHCHSTDVPIWREVDEHAAALDDLREGTISCASAACHGPPHPPAPGEEEEGEGEATARADAQRSVTR